MTIELGIKTTSSYTFQNFDIKKHEDKNENSRIILTKTNLDTESNKLNQVRDYVFKHLTDYQYKIEETGFHRYSQSSLYMLPKMILCKIAAIGINLITASWQKENQKTFEAFSNFLKNRYTKDGLDDTAHEILQRNHNNARSPLTTKLVLSVMDKCDNMRNDNNLAINPLLKMLNDDETDENISAAVKKLIAKKGSIPKALVNIGDSTGIHTPVMIAIKNNLPVTLDTLIENNAHIKGIYFKESISPIQYAIEQGKIHLIEKLHKAGADIEQRIGENGSRQSLLQYAVSTKDIEAVKALLNAGAKSEQALSFLLDETPEGAVEIEKRNAIIKLIVDQKNFDVYKIVYGGTKLLDKVIKNNDYTVMELFVKKPLLQNSYIVNLSPMLYSLLEHLLSQPKTSEDLTNLIDLITNQKLFTDISGMIYAARNNKFKALKTALDKLEKTSNIKELIDNNFLLSYATMFTPNVETVNLLIGYDCSMDNKKSTPPLTHAIIVAGWATLLSDEEKIKNALTIIDTLIEKEADINKCCDKNGTPLYQALKWRLTSVVNILLKNNANVLEKIVINDKGDKSTVLKFATQQGMDETTLNLIKECYKKQNSEKTIGS